MKLGHEIDLKTRFHDPNFLKLYFIIIFGIGRKFIKKQFHQFAKASYWDSNPMMFQSQSHFSEFGSIQNVFRFWDLDNKFLTKFQEIREISRNPKGGNRKFRIHELNNGKFLGLGLIFFKPGIGIGILLPSPGAKGDFFEKKIWEYSLILLLILSRMIVFSTLWRHSLASFAYFKF